MENREKLVKEFLEQAAQNCAEHQRLRGSAQKSILARMYCYHEYEHDACMWWLTHKAKEAFPNLRVELGLSEEEYPYWRDALANGYNQGYQSQYMPGLVEIQMAQRPYWGLCPGE